MQIVEKHQVLIIRMDAGVKVTRSMRQYGFRFQRVKRGYWLVSDENGIFATLHLTLDSTHPENVVYLEE